jgi:4-hydroxyphenylpyruvate dioxygenase
VLHRLREGHREARYRNARNARMVPARRTDAWSCSNRPRHARVALDAPLTGESASSAAGIALTCPWLFVALAGSYPHHETLDVLDSMSSESLHIKRVASVHLFVRDLERSRDYFIERMGLSEIAVGTREFEQDQRARASVVEAGGARLVLLEPLGSKGESFRWLRTHPEGIGRIVFEVQDAEHAFRTLAKRGAAMLTGIERRRVDRGVVTWFDITTPFGDTLFRFVEHEGDVPVLPGLQRLAEPRRSPITVEYGDVDHITSNFLTLQPALAWMRDVMGLLPLWEIEFHSQNLSAGQAEGTGLKSVVMFDPESGIKFANNEPLAPNFRASQIAIFCDDHGGPGVQHLALSVRDIQSAVKAISAAGGRFMPTPGTYYEMLPNRMQVAGVGELPEDIARLRELGILVDGSEPGKYLLQVFMAEAATIFADVQAGPLFFELIERKGDRGFGAGNFRALFDSIERQQQLDGRI